MSFDKVAAVYVWCANNHQGQWSREYRIMSRISKMRLHLPDSAWEAIQDGTGRASEEWAEAHEIYKTLEARHA